MKCTLVKTGKKVTEVKVALGKETSGALKLNTPTDISDLTGLATERDLSKLKLVNGEGKPIEDSVVAVSKQAAVLHSQVVDGNIIEEVAVDLVGKQYTDQTDSVYSFVSASKFTMETSQGLFTFSINIKPGYCILTNIDKEVDAYDRTDALYYSYEKTDEDGPKYTLTMIAPSIPSKYAPKELLLTYKGEIPSEDPETPEVVGEEISAVVVENE